MGLGREVRSWAKVWQGAAAGGGTDSFTYLGSPPFVCAGVLLTVGSSGPDISLLNLNGQTIYTISTTATELVIAVALNWSLVLQEHDVLEIAPGAGSSMQILVSGYFTTYAE